MLITQSGDRDHPSVAKVAHPGSSSTEEGPDGSETAIDEEITRDSEAEIRAAHGPPGDCPGLRRGGGDGLGVRPPGPAGGSELAAPSRSGRSDARSTAVYGGGAESRADPARRGADSQGAQADGRDAAAAVGGVRRGPSRRLPPQPVLRDLSSLGQEIEAVDAAGAPGRREDVYRLLGQAPAHRRSADRRTDPCRTVYRGARREQLHLRRGDRKSEAAVLGRCPYADDRLRRRSGSRTNSRAA